MSDPFVGIVDQSVVQDYAYWRKRLRETRARWIEEYEAPTAYSVTSLDANGKETTFATPFQVGKQRYDQTAEGKPLEWHEGMRDGRVHQDADAEAQLLEGIDAVLAAENRNAGGLPQLTVLMTGTDQQAFFTGGNDQSPHPPIQEGEDYAEYVIRVGRAYERQAATSGTGRSGTSDDRLREAPATDTPGVGRVHVPGGSFGTDHQPVLDRDPDAVLPGETERASESHTPNAGDARPSDANPTG